MKGAIAYLEPILYITISIIFFTMLKYPIFPLTPWMEKVIFIIALAVFLFGIYKIIIQY